MGTKLTFEKIKPYVESRGYSLIAVSESGNSFLDLECLKHGAFKMSWSNFAHRKAGCAKCKGDKAGLQKIKYEELLALASKNGFTVLLSKEDYEKSHNKKLKIDIVCSCGNRLAKTSFQVRNSNKCMKCRLKNGNKNKHSLNEIETIVKSKGYELVSDQIYKNNKQKLKINCKKHGQFEMNLNDISSNHRCYRCSSFGSKGETALGDLVSGLGFEIIKNDRKILEGKELDIYVPSKNFAIEYCGLRWHTEQMKDKNLHYNKLIGCKKQNINLLTIFEDEWLSRPDQIRNIIKAKLDALPKIYARKTTLVVLTKEQANTFLDKNHLQGTTNFILALGLEYEGEILGCATLSKHHRQNRTEAVLSRICFSDKAIVGGSSKLLKYIKEEAKKLGFTKLISWSDNRWSDGSVYEAIGMSGESLPPDYSYTKDGSQRRLSKQSCTKKNLLKKGGVGNTEKEMAQSLGLLRIWDCGKVRWSIDL